MTGCAGELLPELGVETDLAGVEYEKVVEVASARELIADFLDRGPGWPISFHIL